MTKCGNCGATGQTVAHVKACYAAKSAVKAGTAVVVTEKPEDAPVMPPVATLPAELNIPASRYALPNKDGVIEFFQIDRPTKGKYKGWHFASLLIGSMGDFEKHKISVKQVAGRILHDSFTDAHGNTYTGPAAGALRYSRTYSCCAACGASLSDVQSRATGFGPTCADNLGVHYYSKAAAQELLGETPHSCEDFDGECSAFDKACPYYKNEEGI